MTNAGDPPSGESLENLEAAEGEAAVPAEGPASMTVPADTASTAAAAPAAPAPRAARQRQEAPPAPPEPVSFEGTIWPEVDRVLSGVSVEPERGSIDVAVRIPRDEVVRALRSLRHAEGLQFDYLRTMTAVDHEDEGMEVVYLLYSTTTNKSLTVKAPLPPDDLRIETATSVWRAANWYERETMEMFGIRFEGHPDPRNLLMPEDLTDTFPLRRDHPLQDIEVLQGEGIAFVEEDDA